MGENRSMRWLAGCLLLCNLSAFADELRDFGVPPSAQLRLDEHSGPTPLEIPGARLIATPELRELMAGPPDARPVLFDVLGGDGHLSLPGAIWLPGAGRGTSFDDAIQTQLSKLLDVASRGDRRRALVFFCASPTCWLSYNTALRAAQLGYENVRWYRGGIEAWRAAGGPVTELRVVWKRPG
jgi:PQQ-dependent catabolism-associated CXXCW motif protein